MRNDQIYRAYLDEMQALREFVINYHSEHKFSGLHSEMSSEDPDVNRLLESLAFFSARIHESVTRNLESYRYRLYQQLFPYLLTPIPASGILRGTTSGLLTEPVRIERGTDFVMQTREGKEFFWQTRFDTTLYPLYVHSIETQPAERIGTNLYLHIAARHSLHQNPSPLQILINYISDARTSFRLLTYLRESMQRMRVHFGSVKQMQAREDWTWVDVDLPLYGSEGFDLGPDEDDYLHPIEHERLFFKDPRFELFMHVHLPKQEEPIDLITLEFYLSEPWPKGIVPNRDIFQLNCFPIMNLRQLPSRPILIDGSLTQHTILSGFEDEHGFELCKPMGVFQLDSDGLTPMIPGVIARVSPCYEIESRIIEQRGRHFSNLLIHYPEAYEESKQIFVDCLWHQPSIDNYRDSPSEFRPYSFNVLGVQWEWAFMPDKHTAQPDLTLKSDGLLDILQTSHKKYYSFDDLRAIMMQLGSVTEGPYRQIFSAFKAVRWELRTIEDGRMTPGYVIYFFDFDWDLIEPDNQLFKLFIEHFERVLNLSSDGMEVRISLEMNADSESDTHE